MNTNRSRRAQGVSTCGLGKEKRNEELSAERYRVPNLELDGLVVDGDHAGAELDADGEVMDGLEALVGELQQQARLADTCTTTRPSARARFSRGRDGKTDLRGDGSSKVPHGSAQSPRNEP